MPSSWRPPWLERRMPGTLLVMASLASSTVWMPLRMMGSLVKVRILR